MIAGFSPYPLPDYCIFPNPNSQIILVSSKFKENISSTDYFMPFIQISGKYNEVVDRLGFPKSFYQTQNKEDYYGVLKNDLPRYKIYKKDGINLRINVVNSISKLKTYSYTQGSLDGGLFSKLGYMNSKLVQENLNIYLDKDSKHIKTLRFIYLDDDNKLCGFAISYLKNGEDRFLFNVALIKNVLGAPGEREVTFISNEELVPNPDLENIKNKLEIENIPSVIKAQLNASSLNTYIDLLCKGNEESYDYLTIMDKQKCQFFKVKEKKDNPGEGNCLFYSLSVGIIEAIKHLPEKKGKALWERWAKKGNIKDISFQDIKRIKLDGDPFVSYKETMEKLQLSLRYIAAETFKSKHLDAITYQYGKNSTKKRDLEEVTLQLKAYDKLDSTVDTLEKLNKDRTENLFLIKNDLASELDIKQQMLAEMRANPQIEMLRKKRSLLKSNIVVENSPIFKNFGLMVEKYKGGAYFINDKLNILNSSNELHKLAKKAAKHIKENHLTPKEEQIYLIKLIRIKQNIFYETVDNIKRPYVWGSQENAAAILTTLKLNSKINSDDNPLTIDMSFEGAPTIELNNHHNKHWTAQISYGLSNAISKVQKKPVVNYNKKIVKQNLNFDKNQSYKLDETKLQNIVDIKIAYPIINFINSLSSLSKEDTYQQHTDLIILLSNCLSINETLEKKQKLLQKYKSDYVKDSDDLQKKAIEALELLITKKNQLEVAGKLLELQISLLNDEQFRASAQRLKDILYKNILKQIEKSQRKDKKFNLNNCYSYNQLANLTNTLKVLNDSKKSQKEKLVAIKYFENNAKKDLHGWKTFGKAIGVFIFAAVGFITGCVVGAAIGGAMTSWSGPGAILGAALGAITGASKGLAAGGAAGALIFGGTASYGFFKKSKEEKAISKFTKELKNTFDTNTDKDQNSVDINSQNKDLN